MNTSDVPIGVLKMDEHGHVVEANAYLARALGRSAQALKGQPFEMLLTPSSQAYYQLLLKPMLALDGRAEEATLDLRRADCSALPVLLNAHRLPGPGGQVQCGLIPLQRRARLERRLAALQQATDGLDSAVFRVRQLPDGRLRLTYASDGLTALLGLAGEPAVLHTEDLRAWITRLGSAAAHRCRTAMRRALRTRSTLPFTLRLGDGSQSRWLRVRAQVQPEAGGAWTWQGTVYDVTEQEAHNRRLQDMNKLQAVATLAAGVAHDFNNLLGSIRGLAELATLDAAEGSRQQRHLLHIGQAANRAGRLVRQLLDFSRQSAPALSEVTLSDLLGQATPLLRAGLTVRRPLNVRVRDDAWVRADSGQIVQCLFDLVHNAAHAMRGREGAIRLIADVLPGSGDVGTARIRVVDRGVGVPPELLERVFEPFFTTKPVGEGTGLGLASVQGIVSRHGGQTLLHSEQGRGTVVTVLLPCRPIPPVPTASPTHYCQEGTP